MNDIPYLFVTYFSIIGYISKTFPWLGSINHALISRPLWMEGCFILLFLAAFRFVYYLIEQNSLLKQLGKNVSRICERNLELEKVLKQKQRVMRQDVLWRMHMIKKYLLRPNECNRTGKQCLEKSELVHRVSGVLYEKHKLADAWELLLHAFTDARPGQADFIRQRYPQLTENEFRICLLTYAAFTVKEIAFVLQQSANTIQTRRTIIRQKLGICKGASIADEINLLLT